MVQHPAWIEYWKENDGKSLSSAEDRKWFEDHGWYTSSGDMGIDGTPDEEIFCGECEGTGNKRYEIDLSEALKELSVTAS